MNSGNCSVAQDANTNCYNALSRRQVRSVYLITYSRAQALHVLPLGALAWSSGFVLNAKPVPSK